MTTLLRPLLTLVLAAAVPACAVSRRAEPSSQSAPTTARPLPPPTQQAARALPSPARATPPPPTLTLPPFRRSITIADLRLNEGSGLAGSNLHPGRLWALNDSGNAPSLFALSPQGDTEELHTIAGIRNIDWESLDSFVHRGRPLLLIADVGDNGSRRNNCRLHFINEHAPSIVIATAPIRFADGPRDCEGVVAVPSENAIYLIAKRDRQSTVYRADLNAALSGQAIVAQRIGARPMQAPGVMSLGKLARHAQLGQQITGLATLPASGGTAWLSYTHAYLANSRNPAPEGTNTSPPAPLTYPDLPQAEGIAAPIWDPGALWILSEGKPGRLVRIPLP